MQGEGAAAPSPLHPYLFRGTVTPPLAIKFLYRKTSANNSSGVI